MANWWDNDPIHPASPQPITIPGTGNPAAPVMLPQAQANLANTQVGTQKTQALLPSDVKKGGAEATTAAVTAKYAAPLAEAKLQDTISARTDANAKARSAADQHALQVRAQAALDDATRYAILPTLDRAAVDVQRPLATGSIAKLLSPFSMGDYGTNANFVANELKAIGTNAAMQNVMDERAMSPTGSNGLRVTQTEYKDFKNAWGSLDQNQPAGTLKQNLETLRTIFRNGLLRGHGIDPARSKLLLPKAGGPPTQSTPAASPQNKVIDWHELP